MALSAYECSGLPMSLKVGHGGVVAGAGWSQVQASAVGDRRDNGCAASQEVWPRGG